MDSALDRSCDPRKSKKERAVAREKFTDLVNKEEDGPQIATKLLVAKLQSTNPDVCVEALMACDACVRSCGKRFHDEMGKFRFLNEFVKLVSPKFAGERTPPIAKEHIKRFLHEWSEGLPKQTKIKEAYEMLCRQGIITDADIPKQKKEVVPERAKMAPFEDKKRAALLQRLLASRHPEDLQAANRLIREMVKQDEAKLAKYTQQLEDLEIYQNNVKLLREMLSHYEEGQSREIITELHRACLTIQPKLQKMAQTGKENEKHLGEILLANDDLTNVLDRYKRMFGDQSAPAALAAAPSELATASAATRGGVPKSIAEQAGMSGESFDLLGDLGQMPVAAATSASFAPASATPSTADSLFSLDPLEDSTSPSTGGEAASEPARRTSLLEDLAMLDLGPAPPSQPAVNLLDGPATSNQPTLNLLGGPATSGQPSDASLLSGGQGQPFPSQVPPIGQLPAMAQPPVAVQLTVAVQPNVPAQATQPTQESPAATAPDGGLFVSMESIKMSQKPPAMMYDKHGLRILLYRAENTPAPNVDVYVLSAMSTNISPITAFNFQAAVPKTMRVKLQPASATDLPPHNPLAPPASLSQVVLIANPSAEPLRLRFKLTFSVQGQPVEDMGEIAC